MLHCVVHIRNASIPNMTYNVFSGTLNPTQSVIQNAYFTDYPNSHILSWSFFLLRPTQYWHNCSNTYIFYTVYTITGWGGSTKTILQTHYISIYNTRTDAGRSTVSVTKSQPVSVKMKGERNACELCMEVSNYCMLLQNVWQRLLMSLTFCSSYLYCRAELPDGTGAGRQQSTWVGGIQHLSSQRGQDNMFGDVFCINLTSTSLSSSEC